MHQKNYKYSLSNLFKCSSVLCVQDKLSDVGALMQPILTHGSEIWEFHKSKDINSFKPSVLFVGHR